MYGPLRFIKIITHGLRALEKNEKFIIFMDKIILEKSRIII
jgi:hypothetical protein